MAVEKVGIYYEKQRIKPWLVRWYGENNARGTPRRYSKSFKRKRDALAFQSDKQAELNSGGQRDDIKITLEDLCDKFLESRKHSLRKSSLDRYELTISQLKEYFDPTYQVRRIRREDAEMFVATRKIIHPDHKRKPKELSAGARNRYLSCARTIFTAAVDWEYIKRNPFSGIRETKSVPKAWYFITPDDFYLQSTDANEERVCQALDRIMKVLETDTGMTLEPSKSKKSEKLSFPNSRPKHALH